MLKVMYITVLTYTGAVQSPQYVTASSNHSSTLILRWNSFTKCRYVNGLITAYRIKYAAKPNGRVQTEDWSIEPSNWKWYSEQIAILDGLMTYTNYSIQVAAVNRQGDVGPYSHPVTGQTLQDSKLT